MSTGGEGGQALRRIFDLVAGAEDLDRFADQPVPRQLLDRICRAATAPRRGSEGGPPWRVLVVVGDARERLVQRVAVALSRHFSEGELPAQGLASESVLSAPAFVLVVAAAQEIEGPTPPVLIGGAVQNIVLLCHAAGLGTHRISLAGVVPEAVIDFAAGYLGPEIRGGDVAAMLAVGWPTAELPVSAPPSPSPALVTWAAGPPSPELPREESADTLTRPTYVLSSPHRERVMLADQYAHNRAMLAALLERAGYAVEVYTSGEHLVAGVNESGDPSLYIVSDILPDTTGIELVRRLRTRLGARAPMVVSTTRRDTAFRIAGLSAGVDYYLRKPPNGVELYTAARILIDRHRLLDDLQRANTELGRLIAELRATQTRLVQHGKMAALGQLVAGVAHEINTPLAAVVSNNDLFGRAFQRLRKTLDQHSQLLDGPIGRELAVVEDLTKVSREACTRIVGIVRTLRTFARLDEADVKSVDLHEGIESTLVLVAHITKLGIAVERDYAELPPVECHPNQINQVFMNLVVNACQAMGESGRLTIRTRSGEGYVEVQVSDTGCGIPPDRLSRIFDPGYTTKGAAVGTGLGLAIVYQIVEAHGGEIAVDSEVGLGSTFTLRLPVERPREAA